MPPRFDKLVDAGALPQPRTIGGVKMWLRPELEEALMAAPYGGNDE